MPENLIRRLQNPNDLMLHYAPLHSLLANWGMPLEDHLAQWILAHPDSYQEALKLSFEAGCDFASTCTQSSSPLRAKVFGLEDQVHALNYGTARLAREVTPSDRYLAGFVSTSNPDVLEPFGNYTPQQVSDAYKEQISALLEGGVDVIMVVGNHPDESVLAIKAAKELADVPVIAQNVYYLGATGFRTLMGHTPATGSPLLRDAGADVVGASCGLMRKTEDVPQVGHTHYYTGATVLVKELAAATDVPISIQPNAALSRLVEGKTVYAASPDEMVAEVGLWIESGARIIGGCCGTSIEHYRAIAPIVHGHKAKMAGETSAS